MISTLLCISINKLLVFDFYLQMTVLLLTCFTSFEFPSTCPGCKLDCLKVILPTLIDIVSLTSWPNCPWQCSLPPFPSRLLAVSAFHMYSPHISRSTRERENLSITSTSHLRLNGQHSAFHSILFSITSTFACLICMLKYKDKENKGRRFNLPVVLHGQSQTHIDSQPWSSVTWINRVRWERWITGTR